MPRVEQILGAGHLPRLGQGYRGRLPRVGGGGGLHPLPGIPHIHPGPPPINFGAVAQVGRQPRPQPQPQRQFNPLQAGGQFGFNFNKLPQVPKLPGLSKAEKHAMGIIKSPTGLQTGTPRKTLQLLLNPTPKMRQHIDYLGLHREAHNTANDAQFSITGHLPKGEVKAIRRQVLRPSAGKVVRPMEAGIMAVPGFDNPVTRMLQRGVTGEAEILTHAPAATLGLGKHIGMGVANVGEGLLQDLHITHPGGMQGGVAEVVHPHYFASQKPFFKQSGEALAKSYKDMFTTRMIWDDPAQFWNNAISIASLGAGTGLRVARIAEISRAVKAGTITKEEALSQVGKVIKRPGPVERNILIGKADKHFDKKALDNMGIHKREYQTHRPDLPGQPHHLSMPIWAHTGKPEESIIGPPGFDHADLGTFGREVPKGRPRDFPMGPKGMTQARAIIDPETGRVVTVNFTGKAGGMLEGKRGVALREKLTDMANEKLREAQVDPYIHPPAVKGALGGLIQKHALDRLTERGMRGKDVGLGNVLPGVGREIPSVRNPILGASQTGKAGKYLRRDIEMQQNMARSVAEVQEMKRFGLKGPYDKVEPTDVPERVAAMTKEQRKKLTDEIQARAYAIGPLKVHANNWKKLYQGGMDAKDTILKDAQGYVGIKRPPESFKSFKKYAGEKAIARSWHDMVEHDPAKMKANPDAYSYYPKGFWQRLKPGKPGEGTEAGFFKTVDAVTQMVRSGRFLTPAYAAWFLQNGVLHLSQAGVYTLRNANDLRNEWTKMSPEEKANFDGSVGASHFGGGIARTGEGSESTPFLHPRIKTATHKLAKFWHAVDDRPWRRMSLIHELHREGFHTAESWGKLMREDPAKFRAIARRAQHEAIDYSEMGPAERATFQKLFTAWGWTRGASTYTMRFPFQHPAQFSVLAQEGQRGTKNAADWWRKRGGISPQWLEGYMPLTGGKQPLMGSTGILSPGETLAGMLEAVPGATVGQRSSLSEEESPAIGALEAMISGRDRFGRNLVGSERLSSPLKDLAHRFRPLGMLGTLTGSHKGGGTFVQGPAAFAEGLTGLGLERLRDPTTSAALGVKDYEQSLPKPDEIQFRHRWFNTNLPRQLKLYHQKNGTPLDRGSIAQLKGDAEAVERRDMFQYKWAADRGAHSFRSLPAVDRAKGGIKFMVDHHYFTQADARDAENYIAQVRNEGGGEKEMDQAASDIWSSYPIGQTVNQWNAMIKQMTPAPLEAPRG